MSCASYYVHQYRSILRPYGDEKTSKAEEQNIQNHNQKFK